MSYLAIEEARSRSNRWRWVALRRMATLRKRPNADSDRVLLSVSAERGVVPRPDDGGRQLPSVETVARYWNVERNDLVFNPMWAIEGGVAVSNYAGAVSTAYRVYHLDDMLHPRFVHYFVRSPLALAQYNLLVRGVTTFDRSVTREDFEAMPLPVPPLNEQRRIAGFLDAETARIDALIALKQRMIEILRQRERRALSILLGCEVVVTETVEGPSGDNALALRRVAAILGGLTLGQRQDGPAIELPYLRVANVQDGKFDLQDVATVSVPIEDARRFALRAGDVLVLEGNGNPENLGRGAVWHAEIDPCLHQNHVHAVRPDPSRLGPEFLALVIKTEWARRFFSSGSPLVSIATLSQSRLGNLLIPLPGVEEQASMVEAATARSQRMVSLQNALTKQIGLLQEHRQALITAAVTGELDIPGAAA